MKTSTVLAFMITAAATAVPHSLGLFGLSGWYGLSTSDLITEGSARFGTTLEYMDTDSGAILTAPLRGCIGFSNGTEIAAEIPLVPVDDAFDGSPIGDISIAGGWLYETTRGGTALKLTGRITLPTGDEARDSGSELAVGGVTSTTFVDFRLSMGGEYVLNGGRNPFEDDISDSFRFTGGGASYITGDLLLLGSLSGSTGGDLSAAVSGEYIPMEDLAVNAGLSVGLDQWRGFGIHAGAYWTTEDLL